MGLPYLYLILTILLWSATPAVAKVALVELNNYQLLFYTSVVGVVSLFVINLLQGKINLLFKYKKKDYLRMFGMGFLGIFLYYIFLYKSFSLAPAGQVNVVNYLWPIFIVIFSIPILKENYNFKTILAVLITFGGALIAFTKGDFSNFSNQYTLGYLLAALGAVCYGLFSVLGKKFEYDKFSSMLVYYIFATIFIIPSSLTAYGLVVPKLPATIISVFALGGLMNSVAFVFWFKALKSGSTHQIANIIYISPFLAMIWTFLLNKEPFSTPSIIGLVLIILGIFVQLTNRQK